MRKNQNSLTLFGTLKTDVFFKNPEGTGTITDVHKSNVKSSRNDKVFQILHLLK